MDSDLVLGVALAPAALGMALVRGQRADGQVIDRDLIETTAVIEQARSAIMRTYSTSSKHGYRIRGVGITRVGSDPGVAIELVDALTRIGVRNVAVVDPDPTGSAGAVAAAHAADMIAPPAEDLRPVGAARHRRPAESSHSTRRVALGAVGAAAVLTAVVTALIGPFTSAETPAPAAPPSTARSAPVSTAAGSTTRSTFTAIRPPTASRITVANPSPAQASPVTAAELPEVSSGTPEVASDPTPSNSAHLPDTEEGPRPPGPA